MNEKPILFNGDMVRAILDGRKTQTRRPVKPQQWVPCNWATWSQEGKRSVCRSRSPFGPIGTRLWVRETWSLSTGLQHDHHSRVFYKDGKSKLIYWQDGHNVSQKYGLQISEKDRWRPSIHMPRWASRITLEVVDVRVERAQKITEEDAIEEGCVQFPEGGCIPILEKAKMGNGEVIPQVKGHVCINVESRATSVSPVEQFEELWDSIYETKGYGSDANPWVWVCTFKVIP